MLIKTGLYRLLGSEMDKLPFVISLALRRRENKERGDERLYFINPAAFLLRQK